MVPGLAALADQLLHEDLEGPGIQGLHPGSFRGIGFRDQPLLYFVAFPLGQSPGFLVVEAQTPEAQLPVELGIGFVHRLEQGIQLLEQRRVCWNGSPVLAMDAHECVQLDG